MFNQVNRYDTIKGLNPFYNRINIDFNNFKSFNINFFKYLYHVSLRNDFTIFSVRNISKLGDEKFKEFIHETLLFKNICYNIEIKNEEELNLAYLFKDINDNGRLAFHMSDDVFISLCESNFDKVVELGKTDSDTSNYSKIGIYFNLNGNEMPSFSKFKEYENKYITEINKNQNLPSIDRIPLNDYETIIHNSIDKSINLIAEFIRNKSSEEIEEFNDIIKHMIDVMFDFNKIPDLDIVDYYLYSNCSSVYIDTELNFYSNFDKDYTKLGNIINDNLEINLMKWIIKTYRIAPFESEENKMILLKNDSVLTYFDKVSSSNENEEVTANEGNN